MILKFETKCDFEFLIKVWFYFLKRVVILKFKVKCDFYFFIKDRFIRLSGRMCGLGEMPGRVYVGGSQEVVLFWSPGPWLGLRFYFFNHGLIWKIKTKCDFYFLIEDRFCFFKRVVVWKIKSKCDFYFLSEVRFCFFKRVAIWKIKSWCDWIFWAGFDSFFCSVEKLS